jgi:ABC-2 type transport system permease protein
MMVADIWTVMWKESRGLLRVQGSTAKTLLNIVVPVLALAILMPLLLGEEWVTAAWPLFTSVVIPLIVVGITIPQSFAGERERHTLETLLASRLPDRAILFGKMLVAIALGWGTALAVALVGLLPVNLFHSTGRIMVYRLDIALAIILTSFLMSTLLASLGVLISLRAATAQGAQQALISSLLVPLMIVQVVPMVMLSLVPNGREILASWLSVDFAAIILVVVGVLVVLNVGLVLIAMTRFRRARLLLS